MNHLFDNSDEFFDTDFTRYGDPEAPYYCNDWFQDYNYIQVMEQTPAVMIQIINVLSSFLFIYMAKRERQYTTTDEN